MIPSSFTVIGTTTVNGSDSGPPNDTVVIDMDDVKTPLEKVHEDCESNAASTASTAVTQTTTGNESVASSTVFPTDVCACVEVRSMRDVDISLQQMNAIIVVRFTWTNTTGALNSDGTPWFPDLEFENVIERTSISVENRLHKSTNQWERDVKYNATFGLDLDMKYFPFDTHGVSILMKTPPTQQYVIAHMDVAIHPKVKLIEYDVEDKVTKCQVGTRWSLTTRIRRKFNLYLYSVVLPMFAVGTLELSSFLVNEFKDRIGICLTVITTIVFMMRGFVSEIKVTYLTNLHIYYIACIMWSSLICVCNIIVVRNSSSETTSSTDALNLTFLLAFSTAWLVFHALVFMYIRFGHAVGFGSPYDLAANVGVGGGGDHYAGDAAGSEGYRVRVPFLRKYPTSLRRRKDGFSNRLLSIISNPRAFSPSTHIHNDGDDGGESARRCSVMVENGPMPSNATGNKMLAARSSSTTLRTSLPPLTTSVPHTPMGIHSRMAHSVMTDLMETHVMGETHPSPLDSV